MLFRSQTIAWPSWRRSSLRTRRNWWVFAACVCVRVDVYERVQEDDAKQAAIIMASFVYHAAMRDEKLPRKPLEGEIAPASTNPAPSAPAP